MSEIDLFAKWLSVHDIQWSYMSRGEVAHGRGFTESFGRANSARCGISPAWFDYRGWLGAGTQAEYERAAALPRCKRCINLYRQDSGVAR